MISNNHIAQTIQRIERLEEEKAQIATDISELFKEAKGNGLEVKILKKIIALRKKDKSEIEREEQMIHLYLDAITRFEDTPLGQYAAEREDEESF